MAALQTSYNALVRDRTSKPQGTLGSTGLYINPNVPTNSTAQGIQGADGRAYTRTVGDNELSTNRLNQITNQDSLYMQNAARRGLETANRRGMLNSSIASGAAQRSALEAATPLAMQEAAAFQAAQQENLGYLNQNLIQERQIANQMLGQERDLASVAAGRAADAANQQRAIDAALRAQREQLAYSGEQAGLNRAHDIGMLGMQQQHDIGMSDMQWQQNMATLGYTHDFQSREADRDVYRNLALQNNQFSNQRYNSAYQSILNAQIGTSNAAFGAMLQQIMDDPSTSLSDMEGFRNWLDFQSGQSIDNILNRFLGG